MEAQLYHKSEQDIVSLIPVKYEFLPPILFFVGKLNDLDNVSLHEYVNLDFLPPELCDKIREILRSQNV